MVLSFFIWFDCEIYIFIQIVSFNLFNCKSSREFRLLGDFKNEINKTLQNNVLHYNCCSSLFPQCLLLCPNLVCQVFSLFTCGIVLIKECIYLPIYPFPCFKVENKIIYLLIFHVSVVCLNPVCLSRHIKAKQSTIKCMEFISQSFPYCQNKVKQILLFLIFLC